MRLSLTQFLLCAAFVNGLPMPSFAGFFKKSIFIETPFKMEIPFPTRGASKDLQKGIIKSAESEETVLLWPNMKQLPTKSDVCKSSFERIEGVSNLKEVILHFAKMNGIDRDNVSILEKSSGAISIVHFAHGQAIEIDLAKAGWRPGNTYVYVLSPDAKKAFSISPTWHLKFHWEQIKIHW
jgi:hypothetical protein